MITPALSGDLYHTTDCAVRSRTNSQCEPSSVYISGHPGGGTVLPPDSPTSRSPASPTPGTRHTEARTPPNGLVLNLYSSYDRWIAGHNFSSSEGPNISHYNAQGCNGMRRPYAAYCSMCVFQTVPLEQDESNRATPLSRSSVEDSKGCQEPPYKTSLGRPVSRTPFPVTPRPSPHSPVPYNTVPGCLSLAVDSLDTNAALITEPQFLTFSPQSVRTDYGFTPLCISTTPITQPQTIKNKRNRTGTLDKTHSFYKTTRILLLEFTSISEPHKMLSGLKKRDRQCIADFLASVLIDGFSLDQTQRRRALDLIVYLAKSAQILPENLKMDAFQFDQSRPHNDGGFGFIYKVSHRNRLLSVKVPRMVFSQPARNSEILKAHANELVLLGYLSHPNVLPLEGIFFLSNGDMQRICMVSPWMDNGDLVSFLRRFPQTPCLPLIWDIATGLRYLHELGVVHGDLKGRNILISNTRRAVIGDFGISRVLVTGRSTSQADWGTAHWMAPELVLAEDSHPSYETDIWAFGGVCYEIFTGRIPFYQYKGPAQLVAAFLRGGVIPLLPTLKADGGRLEMDNRVWDLLKRCWNPDPSKRPTSENIHNFLKGLDILDNRPPSEQDPYLASTKRVGSMVDCSRVYQILRRIILDSGSKLLPVDRNISLVAIE